MKYNFKKDLTFKVAVTITFILVFFFFILYCIINYSVSTALEKQLNNKITGRAVSIQKNLDHFFTRNQDIINFMIKENIFTQSDKDKVLESFYNLNSSYPYITSVSVISESEETYTYSKNNIAVGESNISKDVYERVKQKKSDIWTRPQYNKQFGQPLFNLVIPIIDKDNKFIGVVSAEMVLTPIQRIVEGMTATGGVVFIVNDKDKIIAHPAKELVREEYNLSKNINMNGIKKNEMGISEYTFQDQKMKSSFIRIPQINGVAFSEQTLDLFYQNRDNMNQKLILSILVILILIATITCIFVKKHLLDYIMEIISYMKHVSQGDLRVSMNFDRQDEIGQLGEAFNQMVNNLRDMVREVLAVAEKISMTSQNLAVSSEIGDNTIDSTKDFIQVVSDNIDEVSKSFEEVTSFAKKSDLSTKQGSNNINEAIDSMREISRVVNQTVEVIDDLNDNSEKISNIVKLITKIAEQTNLLALNASIEAARAGKHGLGFAVVANEIRDLAEETNAATDNIRSLVKEIKSKSVAGIESIQMVDDKVKEGRETVESTGNIFAKIERSSKETSAKVREASIYGNNLDENSKEMNDAAEEMKNMSKDMTKSSKNLATMANDLEKLVDRFDV